MTTTVLRAVKSMGEGINNIRENSLAAIEIFEITAAFIGPILVPMLIIYMTSIGL